MKTERQFWKRSRLLMLAAGVLLSGGGLLTSCSDKYDLDEETPSDWGSSIYDYLASSGNYSNTVRLIEDLGYREVLARTGSVTLFAADDAAFQRFYQNNAWGVSDYSQLTPSQKKLLLRGSMLKNSMQLMDLGNLPALSDNAQPRQGMSMRHNTYSSAYDSVRLLKPEQMPDNKYWKPYRDANKAIYCMDDATNPTIVHFIEKQLTNRTITNDDYDFLFNHSTHRQMGDASVNGIPVEQANIRCSNGFIHKLSEVLTPLPNLSTLIASKPNTTIFNRLMERYCAPYPDLNPKTEGSITSEYNRLYEANVDTVYQKRFFSEKSQDGRPNLTDPQGRIVAGKLKFDPSWNSYYSGLNEEKYPDDQAKKDMAVIMVPSDDALNAYWNEGAGAVLKKNYGSWDNVPNDVIEKLLNVNMLNSLVSSVPSKFLGILNDSNDPLGVETSAIDSVWLGCNGVVYLTNRVYSPTAYVSVSYPALVNQTMRIMNWAIEKLQYHVYLNSLNSRYSFFIPTADALQSYIDPLSYGKAQRQMFRFHWDDEQKNVWAEVIDAETGQLLREIHKDLKKDENTVNWEEGIVKNRLKDILETHIVIGDVEDGHEFYRTKGGTEIRISNVADGINGMTVEGSFQMNEGMPVHVTEIYDQTKGGNGKSYTLDSEPLMGTTQTVSDVLKSHPEFSAFYELMDKAGLFENIHDAKYDEKGKLKSGNACGGSNLSLFNTYHYTIYVPTNESIIELQKSGKLSSWEAVESFKEAGNLTAATRDSTQIMDFLKYHIQDNALFIGATPERGNYETAVINPQTERFYFIDANLTDNGIELKDYAGNTRHVLTSDASLYNLVAREYLFNGTSVSASDNIETTSSAVIHLIDKPLLVKN